MGKSLEERFKSERRDKEGEDNGKESFANLSRSNFAKLFKVFLELCIVDRVFQAKNDQVLSVEVTHLKVGGTV